MTNYLASAGVQYFSISIPSGSIGANHTINAVGPGAFILWGGSTTDSAGVPKIIFTRVTLTSSTNIQALRNSSSSGNVVVQGCIVDGDTTNLIKSVQYGTVPISLTTSGTATISAVTNANTAIHFLGWSSDNTPSGSPLLEYPVLTLSGTTVTATRGGATGDLIVGFVAIEFQGSALAQSVQNIAATSSSSVTSYTATITSANVNNSMIIFGGSQGAQVTNISELFQYGVLTNSTTVTVNVATAFAAAKKYNCSVVTFVSGVLNSAMQRGITTLTGVSSNASAISSVNINSSAVTNLGNTCSATTTALNEALSVITLTDATTVTTSRTSTTANITSSWEVAEFVPYVAPVGTAYNDPLLFGMTF